MSDEKTIGFFINSEIPGNTLSITSDNSDTVRIPFNITRQANGPARIDAQIIPIQGPLSDVTGQPLPPARWSRWLSLAGDREQAFADTGFRNVTVNVNLPDEETVQLGDYQFRLRILGVDNPDEQFDESDVFTIRITGKEPRPGVFVATTLILLILLVALIVGGVLYYLSQVTLAVNIDAPDTVTIGEAAPYIITIRNTRSTTVTNVLLEYRLPDSLLDATATVPGSTFRRCEEGEEVIWCNLGSLGAQQTTTVTLRAIPAPGVTTITNTQVITVTSTERRPSVGRPSVAETAVSPGSGISVVVDASTGLVAVDEPFTVNILAWDNTISPTVALDSLDTTTLITDTSVLTRTQPHTYTVIYRLPQGMRYVNSPPSKACAYQTYFEIACHLNQFENADGVIQVEKVSFDLVPTEVGDKVPLHSISLVDETGREAAQTSAQTPVVETALLFNGLTDYAELGVTGAPESLTVEMWIHPYATDDGQNFIGLHELDGRNVLLIGYYEDGLHVNLRDTRATIKGIQSTQRQHLAVVIKKIGSSLSEITVFINGQQQGEPAQVNQALDSSLPTRPWVLGTDWDTSANGPVASDFYYGRLSDVLLWREARAAGAIQDDMNYRLTPTALQQEKTLIGYWPLEPDPNRETKVLVDRLSTMLAEDSQANTQNGRRYGASWQISPPRFGTTLQFDGINDEAAVADMTLPTQPLAPGESYAMTFAAWVYVSDIPTEEQWLVGQAAPGGTAVPPTPVLSPTVASLTPVSNTVDIAQAQLIAALQQANAIDITAGEALSATQTARQQLFDSLLVLVGASSPPADVDQSEILVYSILGLNEVDPAALQRVITGTDTLEALYAPYLQARNQWLSNTAVDSGVGATGAASAASAAGAVTPDFGLATAKRIEDAYNLEQSILALGQAVYTDSSLPTNRPIGALRDRQQAVISAYQFTLPIARALTRLDSLAAAEENLTRVWTSEVGTAAPTNGTLPNSGFSEALETAAAAVGQAQADLDAALTGLEPALQRELDDTLRALQAQAGELTNEFSGPKAGQLHQALLALVDVQTAEANLAAVREAETAVQEAENNLAQAQAGDAQATQAQQEAAQAQAEVTQRQAEVDAARTALANAPQADVPAARQRLADAEAALTLARQQYLQNLSTIMNDIQSREAILDNLDTHLQDAVRAGFVAGLDAARQNNLERWIGPFLDFILGTQSPQISMYDAVYQAALMGARQQLKREVDFNVDVAQAKLDAALASRDVLRNAQGNVALRNQIVGNIKAYLDSLDAEVNTARQELADAQQKQRSEEEPLIPPEIAEGLARAVAQAIAEQTVQAARRMDIESLIRDEGQRTRLQANIQQQVDRALADALRWPRVELYFWSSYMNGWLDAEINAGIGSQAALQAKGATRDRLQTMDERLLALLQYNPAAEAGLGTTVNALVEQAAASVETDPLGALTTAFRDALKDAKTAVQSLIQAEQGLALVPAGSNQSTETAVATSGITTTNTTTNGGTGGDPTGDITGTGLTTANQPTGGGGTIGTTPTTAGTGGTAVISGTTPITPTTPITATTPITPSAPTVGLWAGLVIDQRGYVAVVARQGEATGGAWVELPDRRPIPTNQWIHYTGVITITASGEVQLKLYRDGADVKNDSQIMTSRVNFNPTGCVSSVYVGGLCPDDERYHFKGRLDDIRIWERALGEAEVPRWLTRPGEFFDEAAYWPLDDGPGRQKAAGTCTLRQSCNLRINTPGTQDNANDRFHLPVAGPAWVEANFGLAGRNSGILVTPVTAVPTTASQPGQMALPEGEVTP